MPYRKARTEGKEVFDFLDTCYGLDMVSMCSPKATWKSNACCEALEGRNPLTKVFKGEACGGCLGSNTVMTEGGLMNTFWMRFKKTETREGTPMSIHSPFSAVLHSELL